MIFTASTVKDTLPNIRRFVAGNLAGGVDHLFVFLDAPDREVRGFLDEHPHVTCIRTDKAWWGEDRPENLNARQRINANLAKAVLSTLEGDHWVFHIDADEIVQLDRALLDAAPAETRAVRLAPLEAVSQKHWDSEPTFFKRLLPSEDLVLLHTLGVIDKPSNGAHFHGHVDGKSGVRPDLDVWLTLHEAVDSAEQAIEPLRNKKKLRLLHYESFSGEDFVRKWTSILAAGPTVNLRPVREPTAIAVRALIAKGLTEEEAAPYLMKIFERTTEDDLQTLSDLGLVEEIDPSAGTHVPQQLSDADRDRIDRVVEGLRGQPKRVFHHGHPAAEARKALAAATGEPVRAARGFLRRS
ncbi:glycosyltransferase family 2 protein [Nocardioides sp.]|uniref:glycosyltransferase family 2 protein n=1 Tax=Nocardioides sp. TaxID=35761 RepID=UPI003561C7F4